MLSRFKDPNNMAKSKLRGQVRFPPFENLNEVALQEIQRFRVTPFGHIQETCLHIPYNSGKKDFFGKTGRESFEGKSLVMLGRRLLIQVLQSSNTSLLFPETALSIL
jgi:hypothetical protein